MTHFEWLSLLSAVASSTWYLSHQIHACVTHAVCTERRRNCECFRRMDALEDQLNPIQQKAPHGVGTDLKKNKKKRSNPMKKILLGSFAAALLTLAGCAVNPNKSYSNSTTVVGFEFSVNPETLFPFLRLGYITNDYANVTKEASYEARREYAGKTDSGVENASPRALNKWIKITHTDSRRD